VFDTEQRTATPKKKKGTTPKGKHKKGTPKKGASRASSPKSPRIGELLSGTPLDLMGLDSSIEAIAVCTKCNGLEHQLRNAQNEIRHMKMLLESGRLAHNNPHANPHLSHVGDVFAAIASGIATPPDGNSAHHDGDRAGSPSVAAMAAYLEATHPEYSKHKKHHGKHHGHGHHGHHPHHKHHKVGDDVEGRTGESRSPTPLEDPQGLSADSAPPSAAVSVKDGAPPANQSQRLPVAETSQSEVSEAATLGPLSVVGTTTGALKLDSKSAEKKSGAVQRDRSSSQHSAAQSVASESESAGARSRPSDANSESKSETKPEAKGTGSVKSAPEQAQFAAPEQVERTNSQQSTNSNGSTNSKQKTKRSTNRAKESKETAAGEKPTEISTIDPASGTVPGNPPIEPAPTEATADAEVQAAAQLALQSEPTEATVPASASFPTEETASVTPSTPAQVVSTEKDQGDAPANSPLAPLTNPGAAEETAPAPGSLPVSASSTPRAEQLTINIAAGSSSGKVQSPVAPTTPTSAQPKKQNKTPTKNDANTSKRESPFIRAENSNTRKQSGAVAKDSSATPVKDVSTAPTVAGNAETSGKEQTAPGAAPVVVITVSVGTQTEPMVEEVIPTPATGITAVIINTTPIATPQQLQSKVANPIIGGALRGSGVSDAKSTDGRVHDANNGSIATSPGRSVISQPDALRLNNASVAGVVSDRAKLDQVPLQLPLQPLQQQQPTQQPQKSSRPQSARPRSSQENNVSGAMFTDRTSPGPGSPSQVQVIQGNKTVDIVAGSSTNNNNNAKVSNNDVDLDADSVRSKGSLSIIDRENIFKVLGRHASGYLCSNVTIFSCRTNYWLRPESSTKSFRLDCSPSSIKMPSCQRSYEPKKLTWKRWKPYIVCS
jgi:hypothetical protein